jgi:hypothetical protein
MADTMTRLLILAVADRAWPQWSVVAMQPAGWQWGRAEGWPDFLQLDITDALPADVEPHIRPRRTAIDVAMGAAGEPARFDPERAGLSRLRGPASIRLATLLRALY